MPVKITHVYFGPVNGKRAETRRKVAEVLGIDPAALRLSECLSSAASAERATETTKAGKLVGLCAADIAAILLGGQQ